MRGLRARLGIVAAAAVVSLLATACFGGGPIVLEAEFEDVMDLTTDAMVMTNNVRVGTVTDIEVSDELNALVTMEVNEDTGLPADVRAVLRQTSLLGERFIDLEALGDTGELASGRVEETDIQTDLEELVQTGNDLLAFIAADQVSSMIQAGAITFGGRGGTLGQVIGDLETFVGDFEAGKDEITRLLDNLDSLLGTLASEAETNAAALEALARGNLALQEEDERLLDSLEDLRQLAVVGERILRENRRQFEQFFAQLEVILKSITAIDGAFQQLLTYLPQHNVHVPNANMFEFVQIWSDGVMCNTNSEDENNPAKDCSPPNPNQSNEEWHEFEPDECDREGVNCDMPGGADHRTKNEPNDFGDDDDSGQEDPQEKREEPDDIDGTGPR